MALRVAVATGNWSNPAIWNGGVLPSPGDIVASNNFTVTIDQNINVDTLTNGVANGNLTAQMTSNSTPSGIVTASSTFDTGSYDGWRAFDRNVSSDWLSRFATMPQWVAYEFPLVTIVTKYILYTPINGTPTSVPRDWTFEGWTGSSWIVLDTVTGNSGTAAVTRNFVNTTAYIKYRINITALNGNVSYVGIGDLSLYGSNDYGANSVAGGSFLVTTSQTITCTGTGIVGGASTVITNTSTGTVNINSTTVFGVANFTINHNATGTLNITSNLTANGGNFAGGCLAINNTGTVNIVGTVTTTTYAICIRVAVANTLNITGDVRMDSGAGGPCTLQVAANNSTVNITGNVYGQTQVGSSLQTIHLAASNCSLNITGSIFPVTGTAAGNAFVITTSTNPHYIKIIGTLNSPSFGVNPVLISSNASSINILSGPFISGQYGFFPYLVTRMHLIPTTSSYFEFRDETTNGAVSPGAIAPATQLVSPATLVDNLAVNNVRYGTSYALGTLTGTLRMPTATQVTSGIQVDNTFGSAVLTIDAIWDYLVTNINTPDSIGMRLKNVSTPQTTGEQLEAFLKLD